MKYLALLISLIWACSGCYVHSYPVTPAAVQGSVYELFTGNIQGTAWVVAPGYLLSAGHMCKYGGPEGTAVTLGGMGIEVHRVMWTYPDPDLCLFSASPNVTANPLIIASAPPKLGSPMETIGWPLGTYYESKGEVDGVDTATALADHGASGSPVFNSHGVFGVLVSARDDDKPGFVFVPLSKIRWFLDFAEVSYTLEPLDPTWIEDGGEDVAD